MEAGSVVVGVTCGGFQVADEMDVLVKSLEETERASTTLPQTDFESMLGALEVSDFIIVMRSSPLEIGSILMLRRPYF